MYIQKMKQRNRLDMEVFIVLIAVISCSTDHVLSAGIEASENPVAVGSNVTLTSEEVVSMGAWIFNNGIVVFIFPGRTEVVQAWSDRATYNSTDSSLSLLSVQLNYSGDYTLQGVNTVNAQLTLSVQEPISDITLRANATNLVEFNDTAILMCSVSHGSSLSYTWLKDNSTVIAGGAFQISDEGSTLTIDKVTRYDKGPYRCKVSNGISQEISMPLHLNISFGPGNTTMWITPMKQVYRSGSNITLSCSAESSPPATIQWMFNWTYLDHFASQLPLENVTESNSGIYKCLLFNTVTSRSSSVSAMLRVMEPIAAAVVYPSGGPAIFHEPFTLSCDVIGKVDRIEWWRDGVLISADNTTIIDMENRTLTLNSVQRSDGGEYQCWAFNAVSNMTSSPYTVVVNYGPMTPVIMGPSMALTGTLVMLNCSSDSYPASQYSWYFNGSQVANTSHYQIGPLTLSMSGKYICMAHNHVTGRNSTVYKMLTVLAPVTMVSIKVSGALPVRNHTFTLTCETVGSVESIMWMYRDMPLYEDSTKNFSMSNATLTFDPLMLSDDGNYTCKASNPLSSLTSDHFTLSIYYGPDALTIMGPSMAIAGHSVSFSCSATSYPPSHYKWYFNETQVADTSEFVTPPLTTDMKGLYTCMAFNNITGYNSSASKMLDVFDPISVQVQAEINPAVEGDSYNMTCSVTGRVEHIYWMKNGTDVHADNTTVFSMDNKTVMFNPLGRYDTGEYSCMAINPVENMTSPPYELIVNYGPETPYIHGPTYAEMGTQVTLWCSAVSVPQSQYSWWHNGSLVANMSMFTTPRLSLNMSGEYTCMVYNNVTGNNSTQSLMLTVIEGIESVKITNNTVPINAKNFTLTCEVTGTYDSLYWIIDDRGKTNIIVGVEGNMMFFTPLSLSDDGTYYCVASNKVGHHKSPGFKLLVNYGPLSMGIYGPHSAKIGIPVSLRCDADSQPECHFYWFLNQSSQIGAGSIFTFTASKQTSGVYKCKAVNPLSNDTMYKNHIFVTDLATALHSPSQNALLLMSLFVACVLFQ